MKNNLLNMLKKELREMFRDKKSLSMMLIIPFMIPLLVLGMSALFESQMNKPVEEYNKIGFDYELSEKEEELAKRLQIEFTIKSKEQLEKEYERDLLDLYVTKEGSHYIIHGEDNETTSYASTLVEQYFLSYKEYLQQQYLTQHQIDKDEVIDIITVETQFLEQENFYANYIINYAFLFIIMAITVSATYPSTDATAGEKERGTLETLLTFPIKSKDIIVGKFLSVSISSMITGIISLLLTIVSLLLAGNMFKIYEGINLMLPISSLLFSIVVIVAYSFLISGLCIAIASRLKSFKEAQSALTPITFISFFPGMIAFMMEIKITTLFSMIPFLNYTLLFADITSGNINFLHIFLMLVSTIIIISIVLSIIIRQYKSEKVLFND